MPHPLINSAAELARIKADLAEMFGNDDQQALLDTAAGMSNFTDVLELVAREMAENEALAAALKARISDMRVRYDRIDARAEAMRQVIEAAMIRADYPRHVMPEMTLSLGKRAPKLVITEAHQIPPEYYVTPPAVLSKEAVKEALLADKEVPGAHMSNGGYGLNVRVK